MSRKIIGVTVGTPIKPSKIAEEILPHITKEDEGKVIGVKDGKYTLIEGGTPVATYTGEVEVE